MPFSVEKIDESMHVTVFHNIVVVLMTATMKPVHVEPLSRHIEDALLTHPRGVVVVSMTAPSLPAPALELRAELNGIFNRFGDRLLLGMPIVDETGIFAAARRAFLRGLLLLLRKKNLAVAGSLDEAIRLCAPFAKTSDGMPVPERELGALFRFCEQRVGGG